MASRMHQSPGISGYRTFAHAVGCFTPRHCSYLKVQRAPLVYRGQYSTLASTVWLIRQTAARKWASSPSLDQAPQSWPYLNPLLLTFFASQKRSMFAARCLVEIVIEIYKQGQGWEDIQLELKLAGLQEQKQIEQLPHEAQKKARLLVDLEKDVLLQWIALIFLTLKELDVKQGPADLSALDGESQMARGMRGFVKQTLQLGFDLERLQLQQQLAGDERGEVLPSVKLMQENARLIVLTSEVVRAAPAAASPDGARQQSTVVGDGLRQSAARVLLAFLGAAQGSLYSVNAFLEEVFASYRRGWTAQQLYTAVRPEEFATGRSLFPVAAAQGSGQANADIFAQWVSAVYITLVQAGVPHDAAGESWGWAWAGPGGEDDAIAANRLSQFVASTLKRQAAGEGVAGGPDSEAVEAMRNQPQELRQSDGRGQRQSFVMIEDPELWASSSAVAMMSQLLQLVLMTSNLACRTMQQPVPQEQSKTG